MVLSAGLHQILASIRKDKLMKAKLELKSFFMFSMMVLLLLSLLQASAQAANISLSHEISMLRKAQGLRPFTNEPRLTLAARKIVDRLAKKGPKSIAKNFLTPALAHENFIWSSAQAYISFVPKGAEHLFDDLLSQSNAKTNLLSSEDWKIGAAHFKNPYHLAYGGTSDILVVILAKQSLAATKNWQQETLALVNQFRAKFTLAPLTLNKSLNKAAQAHADDMFARDFFAHQSPSGTNAGDRATKQGYKWKIILENLATGQQTPAEAVTGWENSKTGHREAMLNANVIDVGIGYRYVANDNGKFKGHHYWAMTMGLPRE